MPSPPLKSSKVTMDHQFMPRMCKGGGDFQKNVAEVASYSNDIGMGCHLGDARMLLEE